MRLFWPVLTIVLFVTYGQSYAREMLTINQEDDARIIVSQTLEGEDFIVTLKKVDKSGAELQSKVIHNVFGTISPDKKSILFCSLGNGIESNESFSILNLETFNLIVFKLSPAVLSDELECRFDKSSQFVMIYDNFPITNYIHVYSIKGLMINKIKYDPELTSPYMIEGLDFIKTKSFGGVDDL